MKHLHFVQSTEPLEGGGLGRAAWELSDALRLVAEDSCLVATGLKNLHVDGLKLYQRKGPVRMFFAPRLLRDSASLVAETDIVHGHGFYVGPNWLLGRQVRDQRKPFVYHVHGIFEPWILGRSRWKKRLAHWLFEDANFRHAGLWRALTLKEADQIRDQGITAPIVVCPNGIEMETFTAVPLMRREMHIAKSKRQLLFLARLHPKKGLDLLLQAWAAMPASLRQDWRIVVAGPDELNHREEMNVLAERLGLSADVEFVGEVRGKSKLLCLATADAFVLPSRSEGFSVAILEAMACRLPVLATDACNFPELATNGGGWCVTADVAGVSWGLEQVLKASESEMQERGNLARLLIEKNYTWPKIALSLDNACEEYLGSYVK